VVHPSLPVKTLQELIALAKSKPGQLNYSSAGNGSSGHLTFEYLKMATGIFVVHVPYRGTGPQLIDLLAGRLQAAAVGAPAILQFIKTGKLRCIGTGTPQRIPQLPDVPTVAEQGYPGFETSQWYGLNAPAKTPDAIIQRLAREAARAAHAASVKERFAADDAEAVGSTPAEYAAFIKKEQARWSKVVRAANIKAD